MRRFLFALAASTLAASALTAQSSRPTATDGSSHRYVPVTDEMLWKPYSANWSSWRRTLDGWGYSPLDQIDRNNVSRINMVWTRGLGTGNVEELRLYDGVNDQPGRGRHHRDRCESGDLVWNTGELANKGCQWLAPTATSRCGQHAHRRQRRQSDLRCRCPHRQHGVGDGRDGSEETRALERPGPIIANGKVITGRQCQPDAGNDACIITAHDAATGREVWRTRTLPLPGEPGYETWGDVPMAERWHVGTWMVPSYDPELNRIFGGHVSHDPRTEVHAGGQRQD